MRATNWVPALLLTLGCSGPAQVDEAGPIAGWPEYGAAKGGGRFSPLTQITPENVEHLEVAWTYHTGDVVDGSEHLAQSSFQNTPILVDGTLYLCTPRNRVAAIDPETGEERWTYDPGLDIERMYLLNCRGVTAWLDRSAPASAACRRRIFMGTLDARLLAIDAKTGAPCSHFGDGGSVDLTRGIGDARPGEYGVTSPPLVIGDLVVTGTMVLDNRRVDAPGGVVRAFDARSGELRWSWDPIPPGRAPHEPSSDHGAPRYHRGTANAWSILSADPERDLVFVPTGNTSPDFYGGQRDGLDYYSSSVVALDANSGEVVWHFQTVHHDLWDYDVPAQPTLFDFPGEKGSIPALVQATKMGHLFFLNRETGEPIFPVEERPVPQDPAPGEYLSPTQPFPTRPPPIHPTRFTAEDAWGFTPWDRTKCRELLAGLRSEGIFTPPSLQGSIHFPGMLGGSNWGSVAIDPQRGILVVNTVRVATKIRLVPRAEYDAFVAEHGPPDYGLEPQLGTPYAVERIPLLSPLGAPCNPPPWGTLVGIDIATGEILWDVTLGTTRDLAPFPLWLKLGAPNIGGAIMTASGLTFIAATTDHYLRAFDSQSGQELWKGRLPAAAQATPMTYRLAKSGRQYVVIAAGGHGVLGTPPHDALVAFALP